MRPCSMTAMSRCCLCSCLYRAEQAWPSLPRSPSCACGVQGGTGLCLPGFTFILIVILFIIVLFVIALTVFISPSVIDFSQVSLTVVYQLQSGVSWSLLLAGTQCRPCLKPELLAGA